MAGRVGGHRDSQHGQSGPTGVVHTGHCLPHWPFSRHRLTGFPTRQTRSTPGCWVTTYASVTAHRLTGQARRGPGGVGCDAVRRGSPSVLEPAISMGWLSQCYSISSMENTMTVIQVRREPPRGGPPAIRRWHQADRHRPDNGSNSRSVRCGGMVGAPAASPVTCLCSPPAQRNALWGPASTGASRSSTLTPEPSRCTTLTTL
jgi:hypothetical protein